MINQGHLINSHKLSCWLCIDFVRRKLMLVVGVTKGSVT